MRLFFISFALVFVALFFGTDWAIAHLAPVEKGANVWIETYFTQARVPMFTGFITLGSFLLTLQTALIQRLKDAFDNDEYKRNVRVLREGDASTPYYGSLARLSIALSTNVVLALTAAASQLTVGFVRTAWSTAVCIALAGTCLSVVIFLTVQMMRAHRHWFAKIEKEKRDQMEQEDKARDAQRAAQE